MKFLLRIILTALFGFLAVLFLPFWSVAVVAFLVAFFMSERPKRFGFSRKKPERSWAFAAGFLGICLLWGGWAYFQDQANASRLSIKIAYLFFQDLVEAPGSAYVMIGLTALTGGLLGGFGAWSGQLLGRMIKG